MLLGNLISSLAPNRRRKTDIAADSRWRAGVVPETRSKGEIQLGLHVGYVPPPHPSLCESNQQPRYKSPGTGFVSNTHLIATRHLLPAILASED